MLLIDSCCVNGQKADVYLAVLNAPSFRRTCNLGCAEVGIVVSSVLQFKDDLLFMTARKGIMNASSIRVIFPDILFELCHRKI